MNARGFAVALLLTTACASYVRPQGPALLPLRGENFETLDQARQDPLLRLRTIDSRWRQFWLNPGSRKGLDRLYYPVTTQLHLAWQYVFLGRDYVERRDHTAAAHAFWAAIALAPRTLGSRIDKERVRIAAFNGLAEGAARRLQVGWVSLFQLCASLGKAYLSSAQAQAKEVSFYRTLGEISAAHEQAERERKKAESRSIWGAIFAGLNAGISAASAGVTAASQARLNPNAAGAAMTRLQQQTNQITAQLTDQLAQLDERKQDALAAVAEQQAEVDDATASLKDVTARDIPAFAARRNSMVAREAAGYLRRAANLAPYLAVLRDFARDKPNLSTTLAEAPATSPASPDWLQKVYRAIADQETLLFRADRAGKSGLQP